MIHHHPRIALFLLLFADQGYSASLPPAKASIGLHQLLPGEVSDASAVFLSEDTLALLVQSRTRPAVSRIFVLGIVNGRILLRAATEADYVGDQLFAVSNGRFLVRGLRQQYLYSPDLLSKWELQMNVLCKQFPHGNLVGEFTKGGKLFSLTAPPTRIQRADGELLSVDDEMLLYDTGAALQVIGSDGTKRGTVPVTPGTRYFPNVEFAGPNRLYFSTSGNDHITDLAGKQQVRISPPAGWGFRHGWNLDGSRLLFDHYLRHTPLVNRVFGAISDALGAGLPESATAEVVRVIEVPTGNVCFDLESPGALLGHEGGYHADLSPSGGIVAVATLTDLRVYLLPAHCSIR